MKDAFELDLKRTMAPAASDLWTYVEGILKNVTPVGNGVDGEAFSAVVAQWLVKIENVPMILRKFSSCCPTRLLRRCLAALTDG